MDYEALLKNFDDLNKQIEIAREEMQRSTKPLIEAAVSQFLQACPEVEGVHWAQYTPYFNDGDACNFGLGDICFHLPGEEFDASESSIIYTQKDLEDALARLEDVKLYNSDPKAWVESFLVNYRNQHGRDYPSYYRKESIKPYPSSVADAEHLVGEIETNLQLYGEDAAERIKKSFTALGDAMRKIPDEIMQTVYGDHAIVIITRSGTVVEEYGHE